MAIQNYTKPQVEVQQTFDNVTPNPAATAFIPNAIAGSFQVLKRDVIGDPENGTGYDGTASTHITPIEPNTIVDTDPGAMQVFIRNENYGTFLVDPSQWTYNSNTNEIELDADIQVDTDDDGIADTSVADLSEDFEVMLSARAMRKVVNADTNEDPYFVTAASVDEIEEKLGLIVPENPLAWGMFWEVIATDTIVTGMLVAPDSSDEVMQDPDSDSAYHQYLDHNQWVEAMERLEVRDVYNIVPNYASAKYHNPDIEPQIIASLVQHAEEMSQPENQGERIVTCVNPAFDESATDLRQLAEDLRDFADQYDTRRLTLLVPPKAEVPVDGNLEWVGSEVLGNIIAGMDAFYSPQQPFTNLPMPTGINRLKGSDDMFREELLDIIASGGNYIITQEVEGSPPQSRHQQTTHTQFIEKNERSIVKAVDYTARTLRSQLSPFIGRFNITKDLLASIRTAVQGVKRRLKENGVVKDMEILTLEQKQNEKDEIRLKVRLTVLYPNNKIDVEIVV